MKATILAVLAACALFLGACSLPGAKLGPGDRIGDMELTTEFEINIHDLCTFDELAAGTCAIPSTVDVLGVSTGWSEATAEALEAAWAGSTWSLTIDGRAVDLDAFGTFDLDWGDQKARVWDVGLIGLAPGTHLARYDFYLENAIERGNHTMIYQFEVLP